MASLFPVFNRRRRLLYHICFWVVIYLCFAYIDSGYDKRYGRAALNQAVQLPVKIAFTYCIIYYLLPAYLFTKKYTSFFLLLALAVLLGGSIFRLAQGFITLPLYHPKLPFTPFDPDRFLWAVFEISFPAVIAASIKLFESRYAGERIAQQLQTEKLLAELRFLKAQISPHFLFNTLNNIYGLALGRSEQTCEAILKLSDLLRFILQHAHSGYISLEAELRVLNDYISLERLRYGTRLDLKLVTEIESPGYRIAPLILLSLVENSFKHGASESLLHPFIHLRLKAQAGFLFFDIENSKEEDTASNKDGIGLTNIRRQLELTYGKLYHLNIRDELSHYCLSLSINVQQHEQAELYHHRR